MINILLLILINTVNSLQCNSDISVKYNYCNQYQIIPDCNYINQIKYNICNTLISKDEFVNGENCTLFGYNYNCTIHPMYKNVNKVLCCSPKLEDRKLQRITETASVSASSSASATALKSITSSLSYTSSASATETATETASPIPMPIIFNSSMIDNTNFSDNNPCLQLNNLNYVPLECKNYMYNSLENLPFIDINNTQQLFSYLNSKTPVSIEDIIIKIGVLTLKTNSLNTLEISTTNFTFLAKQLDNKIDNLKISNFELEVPQFNYNNTVISMISWNINPYLLDSSILIDTNVISISLSDINGTVIDLQNLVNPVKLSWNLLDRNLLDRNLLNSSMLDYSGNCYYWNKTKLNWKQDGCYSNNVNNTYISCNCNHLTDFSAKINTIQTTQTSQTSIQSSSNTTCPAPDSVIQIPSNCIANINMYNNFLQNKESLQQNDTQQIFNNLNNQPPASIEGTIIQAGVLTLKSNPSNQLQISTSNFSFVAKQLDNNNNNNNFEVSNFKLKVPSLNVNNNTAITMIVWNTNPYLSKSSILIDTNVISISLSNLSGSVLDSQKLINPIQLSWIISSISNTNTNLSNSSILNYTGNCYYWNKTELNWKEDGCYLVYVNKTYITCNCTHLTEFSARINAVYQSNINILSNIGNVYSEDGLQRYKNFYIIFGSMGIAMLIFMSIGLYIDIKDFKKYYELLKNTIIKDDKIIDIYLHNLHENNSKSESDSKIKQEEPIKYKYLSMLCNRILFQHTQIGAFFKFDPKMPRLFRIMLIFVGLFNSLFLTALLYGYTSYGSMSLSESFVLSIITAVLNYPSLILLNIFMNYAGLHEFKWRYPLLIDELDRRHKYEDEISMYKSKELDEINILKIKKIIIEDIHFSLFNSIYGYWNELFSIISCKRKKENDHHNNNNKDVEIEVDGERVKGSIEKAYFYATKAYVTPNKQPSYYSLLPFHTISGGFVFFISIGWLIWCLNYLLLFASVHQTSVSDNILISFGFTELQTVFITQPISLMVIIFIGFISNKIKKWCGFHNKIQLESIYYYSDPYRKQYSTELSTRFAFEIFVNIPSQISYSINDFPNKIKNLGYASVESVVEYIEKDDIHFTKKSHKFNKKELAIIDLYERMKNQKLIVEKKVKINDEIIIDDLIHDNLPNRVIDDIKIKSTSDAKFERLHYFKKIQPWKP